MVFSHGNERLQGTHHDAQKSRTTTLPAYFSVLKVSDAETGAHENSAICASANTASQVRVTRRLGESGIVKYPVSDLWSKSAASLHYRLEVMRRFSFASAADTSVFFSVPRRRV
jgi:hypothetical protein